MFSHTFFFQCSQIWSIGRCRIFPTGEWRKWFKVFTCLAWGHLKNNTRTRSGFPHPQPPTIHSHECLMRQGLFWLRDNNWYLLAVFCGFQELHQQFLAYPAGRWRGIFWFQSFCKPTPITNIYLSLSLSSMYLSPIGAVSWENPLPHGDMEHE